MHSSSFGNLTICHNGDWSGAATIVRRTGSDPMDHYIEFRVDAGELKRVMAGAYAHAITAAVERALDVELYRDPQPATAESVWVLRHPHTGDVKVFRDEAGAMKFLSEVAQRDTYAISERVYEIARVQLQ